MDGQDRASALVLDAYWELPKNHFFRYKEN